jgi:hypothetical protein
VRAFQTAETEKSILFATKHVRNDAIDYEIRNDASLNVIVIVTIAVLL